MISPAFAAVNISHSPQWWSWAPRAAYDGAGNLHVIWAEFYGNNNGDLFFSKYTKSTKIWSTPVNLSNSGRVWSETAEVGGIDIDDNGQVQVVWTEQSRVCYRTLAGGNWGVVEEIGYGTVLEGAKVAAVGQGDFYVVWWGNDGVVRSRAHVSGSWEGTTVISSGARSKFPDVAAGNNSVMAVWAEKSGDNYQAAYVLRNRNYGSGWTNSSRVSSDSISQQHPAVEFLNGETPHTVFTPVTDPNRYVAHSQWTGSGFSRHSRISSEMMLHYPSMAQGGGVLIAVWQVGSYGNGQAIYYNGYMNGSWQGETAVPGSNGSTFCDVAIDPTGSAAIVWDASGEIMVETSEGGITPPSPNLTPVAEFSFSPDTGTAPLTVTFDGSASYDPDGTIAQYFWVFGDGLTASGPVVTHTFQEPGLMENTLTVVDNLGKPGTKTKTLEIINYPPVADFTITPPEGIVATSVEFDAGPSSDPDGSIIQYDWIFSDGDTAQGQKIGRYFTVPGNYSVRLIVTDNYYKTGTTVKTFVLRQLKPPLNVRWQSFTDVSLFMSRVVTDVSWDPNPANDEIAPIAKFRVYRKLAGVAGAPILLCGEAAGTAVLWRDTDVETAGQYVYGVTSMDAAGHESPLSAAPGSPSSVRNRKLIRR